MIETTQTDAQNMQEPPWAARPWAGFDTETTGVSPHTDRLVSAAIVHRISPLSGEGEDRHLTSFSHHTWLADPGVGIPPTAAAIHGITTEYARTHGQPIEVVTDEVAAALAEHFRSGGIVVVFNAGFDIPLLEAEAVRHDVPTLRSRLDTEVGPIIDPLVLDRALDRFRKGKRTLSDLANVYGIELPSDTHQAHVDAELTLKVAEALVAKFPVLAEMTASEVHDFQRTSHARWAEDFESYLRKQGRNTTISRNWF